MNNSFDTTGWELLNLLDIDDKFSVNARIWWDDTFDACMKVAQYSGAVHFRIDWKEKQIFTTGL